MFPIDAFADAFALIMSLAIFGNFLYYGVLITLYVLGSLGLYTIAKRRQIGQAWMAWVPLLNLWLLGSISDQYMYVVKDKVRNRRKWMIGLAIAMIVVMVVFYVMFFAAYFNILFDIGMNLETDLIVQDESQILQNLLEALVPSLIAILVMLAVSIALTVLEYTCYYHLFASCDPENKTLFLVLSLIFSFLLPIFTFVCRKKDQGMPPRTDVPPAYIPQPAYQPPAPPAQPWTPPVQAEQPPAQTAEPAEESEQ